MTLLAIDPGRSFTGKGKARQSIGTCMFTDVGLEIPLERRAVSFEELARELVFGTLIEKNVTPRKCLTYQNRVVDEIVIEDFVNDPQSARGGQRNGTSECIGAVEILAMQAGIPFTRQKSAILGPAKLLAGYEQTLKHLPHQDSAYLHGYYYLVQKGILQSKGLAATLK